MDFGESFGGFQVGMAVEGLGGWEAEKLGTRILLGRAGISRKPQLRSVQVQGKLTKCLH